jgi:hypothetical protein
VARAKITVRDPSGAVLERIPNGKPYGGQFINPKTKERWYKQKGTPLGENKLIPVRRVMSADHRRSISTSMKPSSRTNLNKALCSRVVAKFTQDLAKLVDRFRRDMELL